MNSPQLHPLQVNPKTGEPFLNLPNRDGLNIILTPPRTSDIDEMVAVHSDERVYYWLTGTPQPYTAANAKWWLEENAIPEAQKALAALEAARDKPELILVDSCPVTIIRQVKEDGTDTLVGGLDFTLARREFELDGTGWEPSDVLSAPQRLPDKPDIWTVGYYVAPSHHGLGLMSSAFKTVLDAWGIPRMGIRSLRVSALTGNTGSLRVFEKNGLTLYKSWPEDTVDVRGTRKSGVVIYERNLDVM
ncbi:N-acetyltransferase domain-containing protein [Mycena kentingensis (nom. inval.)]|nr:N-acetyltransferase domain-containing protein [Mycena kentingensis (nom. inval.)]